MMIGVNLANFSKVFLEEHFRGSLGSSQTRFVVGNT